MILYFDGGCRPNPGKMEVAVVSEKNDIRLHDFVGYGTNNEAEWIGLLWAVGIALENGAQEVNIFGDSSLVVNQANGLWKVKNESLRKYHSEFLIMKDGIKSLNLSYVPRNMNLAGNFIEMKQRGLFL